MKSNEKIMILIIVVIAVVIIVGLRIAKNSKNNTSQQTEQKTTEEYVDVLSDGTKLNKSNKLSETKKVGGLEISNTQLTHKNGQSILLGNVKNTTTTDMKLTNLEITLLDEKGNAIKKINAFVSPVKAGETVQLNCGLESDYANAYDFTAVIK